MSSGSAIPYAGGTYNGPIHGSAVGGAGNINVINNIHNHGLGPVFDKICNHVAANAYYNSGEVSAQPKCHPGTRIAILNHIITWAAMLTYTYPIVWLYGPAGAGKSAILRTIAQILAEQDLLLASFFFFRSSAGRNSSEKFFPTLAYRLALSVPTTRPFITQAIERDPLIFSASLWEQAQALVVAPIIAAYNDSSFDGDQYPRVFVIDGLDECDNPDQQHEILQVLSGMLQNLPIPFAIFIASRPEHHIRSAFDFGNLNTISTQLSLEEFYKSSDDIHRYLTDRFLVIRETHVLRSYLPSPWPLQDIDVLVAHSSGQFIYASTVDKFISSPRHNPAKRLEILIDQFDSSGTTRPFEHLDTLYSSIFRTIDPADLPGTLHILGVLLLLPFCPSMTIKSRHSPRFLEKLLELDAGEVRRLLYDLESLLMIGSDDEDIRFFHLSLSDYLLDRSRSDRFWIDAGTIYAELALKSLPHSLYLWEWNSVIQMDTDDIRLFFSRATPTPALRDVIINCSFSQVFSNSSEFDMPSSLFRLLLLLSIRDLKIPDAERLYRMKLTEYGEYIQPVLQFYLRDPALKSFLYILILTELRHGRKVDLTRLFDLSELAFEVDQANGFGLTASFRPAPAFQQVMKNLFEDPEGQYFVDEIQFADLTLHFMQCMTKNSGSCVVTNIPKLRESGELWENVQGYLAEALASLLSRSAVLDDLLARLKERSLPDIYLRCGPLNDAIAQYLSRSESKRWWHELFDWAWK